MIHSIPLTLTSKYSLTAIRSIAAACAAVLMKDAMIVCRCVPAAAAGRNDVMNKVMCTMPDWC
ncbi:MAG: hypothetical protein JST22_12505 [Bacteroidetes bacterium]|nr:hypothetical protein [Bacteroidota bacterium]